MSIQSSSRPLAFAAAVIALLLLWLNYSLVIQNRHLEASARALTQQVALQRDATHTARMIRLLGLSRRLHAYVEAGGRFLKAPRDEAGIKALATGIAELEGEEGVTLTYLTALGQCRVGHHITRARGQLRESETFEVDPFTHHLAVFSTLLPGMEERVLRKTLTEADTTPTMMIATEEIRNVTAAFKRVGPQVTRDQGWVNALQRTLMQALGFAAACRTEADESFERLQQ